MTNLKIEKTETVSEKFTDESISERNAPWLQYVDFYWFNKLIKTKWKDNKEVYRLENKLHSYVSEKVKYFEQTFFPKWIQVIKNYSLSSVDRSIELKKKKLTFLTNEMQPIVRTYVDRIVQQLFRTNFSIKAYPLTAEWDKKARIVQAFVERCFSSSKAKKNLFDQWKEAIQFWPWYVRTWFTMPDEKAIDLKNISSWEWKTKKFSFWKPFARFERLSIFSLYGEPFVWFYEQRDIIYRKVLPIKTILNKLESVKYKLTEEHLKFIIDNPKPVSNKNFDKIRLIKYYDVSILTKDTMDVENLYSLTLDNNHVEYIEYWTQDNLVLMMNGYIIYDWPNPLNGKVHPFKIVNFTRDPWVWISDWVGTLLEWPQKLYNALYNISFDLLKFKAWPMFLKQPGQYIEWEEHILNYEPFSFKQVVGPGKIETFELPAPDPAVSRAMSDILEMVNLVIAPSMYNQLQWISRSATDSQFRFEWLKDSILTLVVSMNEMLTNVAEEWIEEAKIKMPNNFKIPVFKEKWWVKERIDISIEDLKGQYIFEWDSESIRDVNKVVERSQLRDLTEFLKTFGNDPHTGQWLIDTRKLLEEWLILFNQPQDILINDKEYLAKLKKHQEATMTVKAELQKYQEKLNQKNWWGQYPNQWWWQTTSNYNQSWWENINDWNVQQPKQYDVASILKAANER